MTTLVQSAKPFRLVHDFLQVGVTPASRFYGFAPQSRSSEDERTIIEERDAQTPNAAALLQHAQRTTSSYSRYLGNERASRLYDSFSTLFDSKEFEGKLPDTRDVDTVIKVALLLDSPMFTVGSTSDGGMSIYWSDGPSTFYASTLDEKLDWAEVHEGDETIEKRGSTGVTYADLVAVRGSPALNEDHSPTGHSEQ